MEITYNGEPRELADGATVADLLAELDRPVQQMAVEVNLELVPRERHAQYRLSPGDQVEVVTLAPGG